MLPSIFNDNLFDDFFNFPFYNDKAERRAEKKLYGHHAHNLIIICSSTFPSLAIRVKIGGTG